MPQFEESQFASGTTRNFFLGFAALLVVGIFVALLVVVAGGSSEGSETRWPAFLPALLVLAVVDLSMLALRLRIRVDDSLLRTQLWPLPPTKKIPREQIRSAYQSTVKPFRDFGGWGVKVKRGHILYSWGGTNAVTVEYYHRGRDRKLTITTERGNELVAALSL